MASRPGPADCCLPPSLTLLYLVTLLSLPELPLASAVIVRGPQSLLKAQPRLTKSHLPSHKPTSSLSHPSLRVSCPPFLEAKTSRPCHCTLALICGISQKKPKASGPPLQPQALCQGGRPLLFVLPRVPADRASQAGLGREVGLAGMKRGRKTTGLQQAVHGALSPFSAEQRPGWLWELMLLLY